MPDAHPDATLTRPPVDAPRRSPAAKYPDRIRAVLAAMVLLSPWHGASAFNFDDVAQRARQLASNAYKAPETKLPNELENLTYDQFRDIRFKPSQMMWRASHLPFVSVLLHPTTGGVTASFATLGDLLIAEPKAMIGFAGPRVIKETTHQDLPAGFQTAEFLQDHGLIDIIVPRPKLRETLSRVLGYMMAGRNAK